MKVITVGGATQDIFIQYEDGRTLQVTHDGYKESYILLKNDTKIPVKGIMYTTGGGATNTAVAFSRLGLEAHPWISIGNDIGAQAILHELQGNQVIIDLYQQSSKPTGTSFIIPSTEHTQTILVFRGANEDLGSDVTIKKRAYDHISNAQALYISSLTGNATQLLQPLLAFAKQHTVLIACNPGSAQLHQGQAWIVPMLDAIDIFIVNTHEADTFMSSVAQEPHMPSTAVTMRITNAPSLLQASAVLGESNRTLLDFFRYIHQQGPSLAIVTDGAQGVYVSDAKHIYFCPSPPVEKVSTVGAGDAFNATFVAYLLQERSIKKALVAGMVNASNLIQHIGAKTGLMYKNELDEEIAKINHTVQVF